MLFDALLLAAPVRAVRASVARGDGDDAGDGRGGAGCGGEGWCGSARSRWSSTVTASRPPRSFRRQLQSRGGGAGGRDLGLIHLSRSPTIRLRQRVRGGAGDRLPAARGRGAAPAAAGPGEIPDQSHGRSRRASAELRADDEAARRISSRPRQDRAAANRPAAAPAATNAEVNEALQTRLKAFYEQVRAEEAAGGAANADGAGQAAKEENRDDAARMEERDKDAASG
jgi:hypothetical protein